MRCLLVLRFTALLYFAEAASFFFHFWPSSTSYPCPPRLGPLVSLCLALSSRGGLLLGGLLLGGFFLAVFGLYLAASLLGPRSRVSVAGVPFSPRSQCTVTVFTLNL